MATGIFSNRYSAEDHSSCLILLSTVGGQRLDVSLLIIVHIYISNMLFKFSCSLLSTKYNLAGVCVLTDFIIINLL